MSFQPKVRGRVDSHGTPRVDMTVGCRWRRKLRTQAQLRTTPHSLDFYENTVSTIQNQRFPFVGVVSFQCEENRCRTRPRCPTTCMRPDFHELIEMKNCGGTLPECRTPSVTVDGEGFGLCAPMPEAATPRREWHNRNPLQAIGTHCFLPYHIQHRIDEFGTLGVVDFGPFVAWTHSVRRQKLSGPEKSCTEAVYDSRLEIHEYSARQIPFSCGVVVCVSNRRSESPWTRTLEGGPYCTAFSSPHSRQSQWAQRPR